MPFAERQCGRYSLDDFCTILTRDHGPYAFSQEAREATVVRIESRIRVPTSRLPFDHIYNVFHLVSTTGETAYVTFHTYKGDGSIFRSPILHTVTVSMTPPEQGSIVIRPEHTWEALDSPAHLRPTIKHVALLYKLLSTCFDTYNLFYNNCWRFSQIADDVVALHPGCFRIRETSPTLFQDLFAGKESTFVSKSASAGEFMDDFLQWSLVAHWSDSRHSTALNGAYARIIDLVFCLGIFWSIFVGVLFDVLGFTLIATVRIITEDSPSYRWIIDTYIKCQQRMDSDTSAYDLALKASPPNFSYHIRRKMLVRALWIAPPFFFSHVIGLFRVHANALWKDYRPVIVQLYRATGLRFPIMVDYLPLYLENRYHQKRSAKDLDLAIELWQKIVQHISKAHPSRSTLLDAFANCVQLRFELHRDINDINLLINLRRGIIAEMENNSEDMIDSDWKWVQTLELASAIIHKYEVTGSESITDLMHAMILYGDALEQIPEDDPRYMQLLVQRRNMVLELCRLTLVD